MKYLIEFLVDRNGVRRRYCSEIRPIACGLVVKIYWTPNDVPKIG